MIKRLSLLIFLSMALFLSACSGGSRLAATSWPGILADEDTIYVAYASNVHAINADSGIEKWRFPTEPDRKVSFFAAPVLTLDGSQLIVSGYDNNVHSLNPETGEPTGWTFSEAQNHYIAGPLVTEAGIFAASADHNLYAISLNGQPLWNQPFKSNEPLWSRPATDGSRLYLAGLDHQVHALDPQSGSEIWSTDLDAAIGAPPALGDGLIFVGTFGSELIALDTDGGGIRWRFQTEDWVWSTPALREGELLVGDISGVFYILDAETGQEIWRYSETDGGIYGQPLVQEDAFYFVTENGKVYSFTNDRALFWSFQVQGKVYGPLVSNGDLILAAALQGDTLVTALNPAGVPRWTFTPEN